MALTSRLALEVDGRNAEQQILAVRRALEGLNEAGLRTGPVLSGASGSISDAARNAGTASGQVQGLERQIRSLAAAASGLIGPIAAAFSVKALYDASEAYSMLTNRMKLVTSSATELAAAQKSVFSIAQSSYQPLSATAELYQRIATNQKELKLTGEGVAGVVGTISKTLAISGASAASANAALVQLGQAFASGVLRGEELNSVMEQAPALAQAIAKGMGVTIGQLRSLGAEGKLTADAVVKALQSQESAVAALFAKTSATIGNSLTALGNSATSFVGQIDQATGSSASLAKEILSLSSAIDGSLPKALSLITENSSALSQVMTTGLYVALARVTGGFAQQATQAGYAAVANQKALTSSAAAASQDLAAATAKQADAKASVDRANAAVASAQRQVAADREVAASELNRIKMVQAALVADRELELQRLKSQITSQGLAASQTRLAELSRANMVITGQVAAAEKALAATTVASSAQIEASYAARTAAVAAYGETTAVVNAATVASTRAAEAASLTSRAIGGLAAAGTGLLAMLGGPLGLLFITGAVALSFTDFRSSTDKANEGLQNLKGPLDEVIARFKQLTKDQQAAALVKWGEAQAESARAANEEYSKLTKTLQTGLIGARSSEAGTKVFKDLTAELQEATASGKDLSTVFEKYRTNPLVPPSVLDSAIKTAGALSGINQAGKEAGDRIAQLKGITGQTSAATVAAADAMSASGKKYNEELQKQLGKLQDNNDAVKEANRYIAEHKELTAADKTAILSTANALNAQTQANKDAAKAAREANKAYQEDSGQKMLDDARQRYAVLMQQKSAIDQQGSGAKALGVEAKKLIELETELADLKTKKTLTTAQKQILAMGELNVAQQKQNAAVEKENELTKIRLDNTAKLVALQDQLEDQLKLAQDGLDSQVAGLGMGQKGRERIQEDLRIRQDYQKQLEKLQRDYNKIVNPTSADKDLYDQETSKIKDALAERLKMQQGYYIDLDRAQRDWTNGANAALQDYMDEASNVSGQTYTLFSNSLHGLEDVFVNLATTGKLSFKSLVDSVIADVARMAAKMLIVQPLISALFGGGGGGVSAVGGVAALLGISATSGSSNSGGTSIGSVANTASSAYSLVTGVGPAASAGYTSGGVVGAVKGVASYYGNITSSAVSSIAGSASQIAAALTGQTAAYGATQGAYTGSAYASWVASQGASQGAASAGGSAAGGAALWPLAIIMGMYQSGKLYDAGLRYDKGEIEGSELSKLGDKLGTVGLDRKLAFESIGLADKVASKLFGGKVGAMLSGSTFAMSVENLISSKLFGTGYQTKDSGLSLQVTNGDLNAQSYQDQKKKGGLLSGKSKKRTLYSALDDDQKTQLDGLYAATQLGVIDLVKQIGVTVEDGAFDAMKVAEMKISTQGKTNDEIQAAVSSWFNYASDVMVATLDKGVNGFGYSFTELARRINVFSGFNAQLDVIDVKMYKLSAESMELANALVEAAGGTEAMTANINTYYDKFFSDTEKTSDALAAVQKQFSDMDVSLPGTRDAYRAMVSAIDLTTESGQQLFLKLTAAAGAAASAYDILEARQATYYTGFYSEAENTARSVASITAEFKKANVTLPDTRAGYRKMVEGIDQTTESGKKLYETLMALSADADTFYKAQEQTAAAAQATAMTAVSTAMSALQRAVDAQKTALTNAYNDQVSVLNDSASTLSTSISGLTSIGNSLDAALKSLNGTSDTAVRMLRSQAEATLQSALATARAGGSLSGFSGLTDALSTVSDNNTDLYSSLEDFNRDQGRTANVVAELNAINGVQLTTEQKALEAVQDQLTILKLTYDAQIKALDDQLKQAQDQVDALNGIDNSVLSVVDALNAFNASVQAAIAAAAAANKPTAPTGGITGGTGTAGAPSYNDINAIYNSVLGRDADAAGAVYWGGQAGSMTAAQLAAAIKADAQANGEIPKFAKGGFHSGGIRLVGENGPEIEATGPARYWSASKSAAALNGVASAENAGEMAERQAWTNRLLNQLIQAVNKQTKLGMPVYPVNT